MKIGCCLRNGNIVAFSLYNLGLMHMLEGGLTAARARLEEGLEMYRALGDRLWIAASLLYTGYVDCKEGDQACS